MERQDALAQGNEKISGLLLDQALFDQLATSFGQHHFRREVLGPHLLVADPQIFPRKLGEFLLRQFEPRLRALDTPMISQHLTGDFWSEDRPCPGRSVFAHFEE